MTKSELAAFIKDTLKEAVNEIKSQLSIIPDDEHGYCTIAAVAQRFKVTKATIYNWVKSGTVKKYKINGRTLYRLPEIESIINRPAY